MTIDDRLKIIVQDVWDKDVKSVPEAIEEIKALFQHGTCFECIKHKKCDLSIYLKYIDREKYDGKKSYCSEFKMNILRDTIERVLFDTLIELYSADEIQRMITKLEYEISTKIVLHEIDYYTEKDKQGD